MHSVLSYRIVLNLREASLRGADIGPDFISKMALETIKFTPHSDLEESEIAYEDDIEDATDGSETEARNRHRASSACAA